MYRRIPERLPQGQPPQQTRARPESGGATEERNYKRPGKQVAQEALSIGSWASRKANSRERSAAWAANRLPRPCEEVSDRGCAELDHGCATRHESSPERCSRRLHRTKKLFLFGCPRLGLPDIVIAAGQQTLRPPANFGLSLCREKAVAKENASIAHGYLTVRAGHHSLFISG